MFRNLISIRRITNSVFCLLLPIFSTLKRVLVEADDDDNDEALNESILLDDDELAPVVVDDDDDVDDISKKLVSEAAFTCRNIRIRSSNILYICSLKKNQQKKNKN